MVLDVRPINTKRKLYFSGIDCTEVSVYLHTHKYMYTCVYMYYTMYVSIHRYMGGSLHVCVCSGSQSEGQRFCSVFLRNYSIYNNGQ